MHKGLKESLWVFLLGAFTAVLWWTFYVQPNNEIMTNIMDCMDGDRSRETYDDCRKLVLLAEGKR